MWGIMLGIFPPNALIRFDLGVTSSCIVVFFQYPPSDLRLDLCGWVYNPVVLECVRRVHLGSETALCTSDIGIFDGACTNVPYK